VEQLHLAGVQVVVIEDRPDPLAARLMAEWGIPCLSGRAQSPRTLENAGLAGASAVICVQHNELQTLETALTVHKLRPDVRVVVHLSNAAVGRAVAGLTGPGSVLDVADLSAPSMVEACLQRTSHELDIDGTLFVVAAVGAEEVTTLRERYGDLAPVAVVSADGTKVTICPGRDQPVGIGDTVHLIGTPTQLDDFDLPWHGVRAAPVKNHWSRPFVLAYHGLISLLAEAERGLKLAVSALGVVVVISTIVLMIGYRKTDGSHMNVLDGVYFSVETIGTIGYGDFSFAEQSGWLRAFAIGLMISGVLLAAIFFALLTNLLVSRKLEESLGRKQVTGLHGHMIVIGLGSVGLRVVEGLLAQDVDVVIIESDENNRYLTQARALHVPILIADATQRATLEDANLANAKGIAVMTSDDLTNIETGLVLRDQLGERWAGVPVVLRLFDRELGRTVEGEFGFRHVRSTAALAAPWFVAAALGLDVISTFYVEQQPFLVGKLRVASGGGLDGLTMSALSARTRVIAIHRAGSTHLEYPPRRDTRFEADDVAYFVGPYEELIQVLRRDTLSPASLGHLATGSSDGVPEGVSEGESQEPRLY
jgi:Trk K+ transport system NAD-binding subunit